MARTVLEIAAKAGRPLKSSSLGHQLALARLSTKRRGRSKAKIKKLKTKKSLNKIIDNDSIETAKTTRPFISLSQSYVGPGGLARLPNKSECDRKSKTNSKAQKKSPTKDFEIVNSSQCHVALVKLPSLTGRDSGGRGSCGRGRGRPKKIKPKIQPQVSWQVSTDEIQKTKSQKSSDGLLRLPLKSRRGRQFKPKSLTSWSQSVTHKIRRVRTSKSKPKVQQQASTEIIQMPDEKVKLKSQTEKIESNSKPNLSLSQNDTPKRGRGRPPKSKMKVQQQSLTEIIQMPDEKVKLKSQTENIESNTKPNLSLSQNDTPKRGRGRPPKSKMKIQQHSLTEKIQMPNENIYEKSKEMLTKSVNVSKDEENKFKMSPGEIKPKIGRGRPPKLKPKIGRGRPPKLKPKMLQQSTIEKIQIPKDNIHKNSKEILSNNETNLIEKDNNLTIKENIPSDSIEPFECHKCNFKYFEIDVFQEHFKEIHKGKDIPCNLCDFKARTIAAFRAHQNRNELILHFTPIFCVILIKFI